MSNYRLFTDTGVKQVTEKNYMNIVVLYKKY